MNVCSTQFTCMCSKIKWKSISENHFPVIALFMGLFASTHTCSKLSLLKILFSDVSPPRQQQRTCVYNKNEAWKSLVTFADKLAAAY